MNDLKKMSCCFTGHRKLPQDKRNIIFDQTYRVIKKLIIYGYRYFNTGGAIGFDTIAALAVLKLKEEYPDIKLILNLPCITQTKGWSEKNTVLYEEIKNSADKILYISNEYFKGCMHKRNQALVNKSSVCICYLTTNKGGTYYTVNYAQKNKLKIINIGEDIATYNHVADVPRLLGGGFHSDFQ